MDERTAKVLYDDYGRGEERGEFLSRSPSGRPIVITALSDPRMTDRTLHHVTATRYRAPSIFRGYHYYVSTTAIVIRRFIFRADK